MSLATKVRQNTRKNEATVESVRRFGDGLVRISTTPRDADLTWVAGQAVAVIVDPDGATLKDRWRHYTVRAQRPDGGLDFVVVEHDPSTPAGSWLADLDEGDTFPFMGPGGRPPDHVDRHWQAYVTGELHAMRALRNRLSDVGVPRRAVHTHAHWTPTKRGM